MIPFHLMKFFHQLLVSPRYPKLDLASTFEARWLSNLEATLIHGCRVEVLWVRKISLSGRYIYSHSKSKSSKCTSS